MKGVPKDTPFIAFWEERSASRMATSWFGEWGRIAGANHLP
jgi:hypothetical protein